MSQTAPVHRNPGPKRDPKRESSVPPQPFSRPFSQPWAFMARRA